MVAIWNAVRRDLVEFCHLLRPPRPMVPGLYTYRFEPPGGKIRVHLRL
jgi:hypothetical protein